MSKWSDLIHYRIIREAFTDESGSLRLKCSDRTIRSLVTGNSFLRHIFNFPRYMEEKDILALVGQNSEEYQAFVESLRPLHLAGKLQRSGKTASVILNTGGEVSVKITHKTMFEAGIEEGAIIHAFGDKDKRHTIKAVVSDELYEMTSLYCGGDWEQLTALEEFLLLPQNYQQAIKRVMCDRQTTRSTLLFLTYAASRSADHCDLSSDEAIETATVEFNQQYTAKLNCIPVCLDDIQCILDVMGIQDTFLPHRRFFGWASDYFSRFLVVYSIVQGISPWLYGDKTKAQVLCDKIPDIYIQVISEHLPHLTDRDAYQEIMDEVLANSKTQSYKLSNWEDLLFEGLTVSKFEPAYIERACDILFEESIAEYQVTDMKRLLSGPNGDRARSYIFKKFFERFNAGEAAYHFAASSILNTLAYEKGTDPLAEAVESAILPFGKDDILLGVTRVGLIIWTQLGKRKQLFNEDVVSSSFVQVLLENLRSYDKRFYSSTASTIHDLIVAGWLSPDILNEPEIFKTAVTTLKEQDGKMWAARLISLLHWDDAREIPEHISDLYSNFYEKMEKALCHTDDAYDPEVYFGLLVNLGWWRNRNLEKLAAFQKIKEFYKNEADETQLRRLRLLQNQLNADNSLQGIPQQTTPLSSEMQDYFMDGMK